MEYINVCFPIAKELLQPLGLKGSTKHDLRILQAALVYVCKNSTNEAAKFDDDFRTIMNADFSKRKQYFISVRQELWAKLNKIAHEIGLPICRLMAWGIFCVQQFPKQKEKILNSELSAISAKEPKNTKDAVIGMLHKDLQRIIDDLVIDDNELWLIANRETRSRLLILVDMADYVYDLVKKELERGE